MNYAKLMMLGLFILLTSNYSYSQSPSDAIWGVYASGVGEKLKPGMDPCWVTYTVALTDNPKIIENVKYGLMGVIISGVNWFQASATQRLHSRYFDDQADGIFKLSPCEVVLPNLNGRWISNGKGYYALSQSDNKITGSAGPINNGDHWGKGHREGGSITGYIENDGTIILRTTWGDGTFTEDFMRLSNDQSTLSGSWNWYTNPSKVSKKGTGNYSISKNN